MSTTCFRDLESSPVIGDEQSALGEWYASVRDTPIRELGVDDLARACRQGLYLDHVVPVALSVLRDDVNAGSQYDGELASVLTRLPPPFWRSNGDLLRSAADVLKRGMSNLDDDVRKEVEQFLIVNNA
jgi:hypothetical protein